MKSFIRYVVLFIFVLSVTQSVQARFFEARSVRSRLYEVAFRVRRPFVPELTDANVQAYFTRRFEINQAPFEIPFPFSNRVESIEHEGLEVLFFDQSLGEEVVVLYLHGGSYVNLPNWIHFHFITRLIEQFEVPVYLPLYPRAPNATIEEALPLLINFYENLLMTYPSTEIVLMGDSAGASLALASAFEIANQELTLPSHLALISPWLDLALDNPEIEAIKPLDPVLNPPAAIYLGNAWRGNVKIDDPRVSPLFGDLSVLTMPVMMVMGTYDVLYPDAVLFAQRAQESGLRLSFEASEKMLHVYPLFPFLPEGQRSLNAIVTFLRGEE